MRMVRIILLTAIWLALWSDASVANAASGLVVAGGVVAVFGPWRPGTMALRPLRAVAFVSYFVQALVKSTLTVGRAVIAPRGRIHTGIVAIPLRGCSDALATLIAAAVSLTPGTLTLEVRRDPLTLFVHALDVRDVERVQADVRRLEVLAVRAFGDRDAIAGLAVDDISSWRGR